MQKLIFVTGNANKFREAQDILRPHGIELLQRKLELVEPQLDDAREVAVSKGRQAFQQLRQALFVDDTALVLKGTRGFPGAYTAAVARTLGARGFSRLLAPNQRGAFYSHVCFFDGEPAVFTGRWRGRLTTRIRFTEKTWPYNSMFIPDGFEEPLSRISWQDRLQHSHRRRSLDKLARFLSGREW